MGGQCHVRTFEGHTGGISCVQFDGGRIVSGSHDKTIKVWNVKTNSPWSVITLAGHSGEVRCLHLGKILFPFINVLEVLHKRRIVTTYNNNIRLSQGMPSKEEKEA